MARLSDEELLARVGDHDRDLEVMLRRVLAQSDARYANLVGDIRRVLPRVSRQGMTPDVLAAFDRIRAAVREAGR